MAGSPFAVDLSGSDAQTFINEGVIIAMPSLGAEQTTFIKTGRNTVVSTWAQTTMF
jgi:hypothetical protein